MKPKDKDEYLEMHDLLNEEEHDAELLEEQDEDYNYLNCPSTLQIMPERIEQITELLLCNDLTPEEVYSLVLEAYTLGAEDRNNEIINLM